MHEELYELKEKLVRELSDYAEHGKFSKDDVETIKYLSSAIDHICNIVDGADEGASYGMYSRRINRNGYSRRGGSYAPRRDSRGRYSRGDGMEDFMWSLGEMMGDFPEEAKKDAERLMRKLEEMR